MNNSVEGADREQDPVLPEFLRFLAQDIGQHPERLRAFDRGLVDRIQALTRGVCADLSRPLDPEDD